MTQHIEMPTREVGKVETHNQIITPNWRTALAAGNASYGQNGNYWTLASPRRLRRALARKKAKKAGAKHG